jgi:hypothetical protein
MKAYSGPVGIQLRFYRPPKISRVRAPCDKKSKLYFLVRKALTGLSNHLATPSERIDVKAMESASIDAAAGTVSAHLDDRKKELAMDRDTMWRR